MKAPQLSRFTLGVLVFVAVAAPPAGATPITYAAPKIGGVSHLPTFGEAFTAPVAHTVLNSFSFYLETAGGSFPFSAYMYDWTGSAVSGSPLFSGNGTASSDEYQTFSPNLTLVAGQSYFAMFSWPAGFQEGYGCAGVTIDCPGGDPSPNTDFRYSLSTTEADWHNPVLWNAPALRVAFAIELGDTVVVANTVPEPASLALLGTGLSSLVVRARRRAKRR